MPSQMLRAEHLDHATYTRVRAFARAKGLSTSAAFVTLATVALDHLEARTAGGNARSASLTGTERSDIARQAAQTRWAKRKA